VKTIGDAAMAAFPRVDDAVRAAARIQRRYPPHNDEAVRVRVTLNAGRCLAVNLNSGIDYFGLAVNAAAKLQRYAGAGDVVFPAASKHQGRSRGWGGGPSRTPWAFYTSKRRQPGAAGGSSSFLPASASDLNT
jgi:class 3 adenylate cyclase